ncbi:MAG: site-specific DNA-methyltransferase [Candidatus Limnocylindrales bacterium]
MTKADAPAFESTVEVDGQRVFFHSSESMPELEAGSVDLIVTSPPYWDLKNYHPDQIGRGTYEEYLEDLGRVWDECYRVARQNGVLVVNVNSRRVAGKLYPIAMDLYARMRGWELLQHLIWYIPNALPQPSSYIGRLHDHKFEDVLVFAKGRDYKFNKPRVPQKYRVRDPRDHKRDPAGRSVGDVLRIPAYRPPTVRKMNYHVAAFPEELVHFFVYTHTDPGDLVLDPFLGSGTTLKVARVCGRRGVGYEVNPGYADLVADRIRESWTPSSFEEIDVIASSTADPDDRRTRRRPRFDYRRGDDSAGNRTAAEVGDEPEAQPPEP